MGCSNTKHIIQISQKEKEEKPQHGSLSAKGLASFNDKRTQQEKIDVGSNGNKNDIGSNGNNNETTQIAIWQTPSTEIHLNIEKTMEQTATITYSKSQYSNTPTISSEIVYEISPEFEDKKFKTYVSEYGEVTFGQNISNNIEFFSKQLKILEILGQGAFGKVLKAYYPPKGLYLALKYFKKKDKAYEEIQSLKFMLQLQSNTIMKFYMAFEDQQDKQVVIVLEYGKATLSNLINVHSCYSEGEILSFIRQVVKSFILLKEELKMAHRDVKPENFILSQNKKEFIICDFGEACLLNENATDDLFFDYPHGTVPYMAPEVYDTYQRCHDDNCGYKLKFNPYKADIYSLGVTILIMFGMPRELRNDLRNKEKQDQILQDCGKRSELLSKLVTKMIEINPEDRFDYTKLNSILQSNDIVISCVEINETKFMEKVDFTFKNCIQKITEVHENFKTKEQELAYYENLIQIYKDQELASQQRQKMLEILDLKTDICCKNHTKKDLSQFLRDIIDLTFKLNMAQTDAEYTIKLIKQYQNLVLELNELKKTKDYMKAELEVLQILGKAVTEDQFNGFLETMNQIGLGSDVLLIQAKY